MKVLAKVSFTAVSLVAVAGVLSGCSTATSRVSEALPHTAAVTSEAGRMIAADLTAQLQLAKQAPRPVRTIQTASVEIAELVDAVLVEASRLPASERLVDAQTAGAQTVRL